MQRKTVLIHIAGAKLQPFLKRDAASDIAEGRCVLCHTRLVSDEPEHFCLIGRHNVLSQGDKLSWADLSIVATTEYAFQSAYVEICGKCYKKYSRRSSLALKFALIIPESLALAWAWWPLSFWGLLLWQGHFVIRSNSARTRSR